LQKSDKHVHPGTEEVARRRQVDYGRYFGEGVAFEILQPGSEEWVKGRMRLKMSIEFLVDQADLSDLETQSDAADSGSENSLDAIRQASNTLTD
jgi:hypothetical protein